MEKKTKKKKKVIGTWHNTKIYAEVEDIGVVKKQDKI